MRAFNELHIVCKYVQADVPVTFSPWPLTLSGVFCWCCFCCGWITSAHEQPIWHVNWDPHCCLCCLHVSLNNGEHDFGPVCSWPVVFWWRRRCFRRHFAAVALRVIGVKEQASYPLFFPPLPKSSILALLCRQICKSFHFCPFLTWLYVTSINCGNNRITTWTKKDLWIKESYAVVISWTFERFASFCECQVRMCYTNTGKICSPLHYYSSMRICLFSVLWPPLLILFSKFSGFHPVSRILFARFFNKVTTTTTTTECVYVSKFPLRPERVRSGF